MGSQDKEHGQPGDDRHGQESMRLIDITVAMRNPENWPAITLADYRALWRNVPRPTATQIQEFALFVAGAHSWYKHLPMFPPGGQFCFYLDPAAGMDYVVCADKEYVFLPRHDDDRGLHYSWMPTKVYRQRFGSLSYSCPHGSTVYRNVHRMVEGQDPVPGVRGENPDGTGPIICLNELGYLKLPPEVINAGTVWITGAVHELADELDNWQHALQLQRKHVPDFDSMVDDMDEPYRAVAMLCRRVDDGALMPDDAAIRLPELLAAERASLLHGMEAAIARVVDLCCPS